MENLALQCSENKTLIAVTQELASNLRAFIHTRSRFNMAKNNVL